MKTAVCGAGAVTVDSVTYLVESHLSTWGGPCTLHVQETKEVEFGRTTGIHAQRLYV